MIRGAYKLGYLYDVREDDPVPSVRYAQVGIMRKNQFTGYAHDYNGGGS